MIINGARKLGRQLLKLKNQQKLPCEITEVYIQRAKAYMQQHSTSKITVEFLYTYWKDIWSESELSKSGTLFLMKKYKGTFTSGAISYLNKMLNQKRVRDFFDAAYLQSYLENREYELIYVDEFHVSMKSSTLYNWSLKGYSVIISVDLY